MQLRPPPRWWRAGGAAARAARLSSLAVAVLALAALHSASTRAGVLPEDEADFAWNRYSGGGQVIDGKTWLIRKKIGDKVSVEYTHLIDVVSGASIDVQLSASPYVEQRTQDSLSAEYMHGKSTYSVSFSQDMFGDLTTVSMSYRRTWNDVFKMLKETDGTKVHDPAFGEKTMDQR